MTRKAILAWTCIWTLLALLLVAWAALAEAGAKTKPRPQSPPPLLTIPEQYCRAIGKFTHDRATDRDDGHAVSEVLAFTRRWDVEHDVSPKVIELHDAITLSVFSEPSLSPAQVRNAWELGCLQSFQQREAAPARPTTDPKLRY